MDDGVAPPLHFQLRLRDRVAELAQEDQVSIEEEIVAGELIDSSYVDVTAIYRVICNQNLANPQGFIHVWFRI